MKVYKHFQRADGKAWLTVFEPVNEEVTFDNQWRRTTASIPQGVDRFIEDYLAVELSLIEDEECRGMLVWES